MMRKASDEVVDKDNPLLRLKNIYLRTFAKDETEFADCNMLEVISLKKRAEVLEWAKTDMIR